jgi:hypothetical protein
VNTGFDAGEPDADPPFAQPVSRAALLAKAFAGGAALAGGGIVAGVLAVPGLAAERSKEQDERILNYLRVLEHLQETFYADARRRNALRGELREFAQTAGAHERKHVQLLTKQLGRAAKPLPAFRFGGRTAKAGTFVADAVDIEEAVVGAYIATAPNLSAGAMETAGSICAVDGRHAAWIRSIAGEPPAPAAADPAQTQQHVLATIRRITR